MSSKSKRSFLLIGIPFVIMAIASFFLPDEMIWDERIFVPVIKSIGQEYLPNLDQIKNLDSPLGPVFFVIYGFVGKLCGFSLLALRLFNIMLSFGVCILVFKYIKNNVNYPILLTFLFIANPYFLIMTAPLIYTDILATLFVVLSLLFLKSNKRILVGIMFGLAICTRQLMIIFPLALGIVDLWYCYKKEKPIKYIFFDFIPIMMYLPFIFIWKGVNSPAITSKNDHVNNMSNFDFSFSNLNYAIIMIFIFSVPVIWRKLSVEIIKKNILIVIPTVLLLIIGMPIRLNQDLPDSSGMPDTAGALDLIFAYIQPISTYLLIPLLLFAGLVNLRQLMSYATKSHQADYFKGVLICFLVLFAINSVAWDKYFIPLIPIIFLAAAQAFNEKEQNVQFA